jgi:hypothetical protein
MWNLTFNSILLVNLMKNQSLSLSIPNRCSEKWENFSITGFGGYCSSCERIVVDFTKMSDEQLVDFFASKRAHTCGRFRREQLKVYSVTPLVKLRPGLTVLKAGLLSLLLLLINKNTSAQITNDKATREVVHQPDHGTHADWKTIEGIILKGTVVSAEDKSALPGVNVLLKETTIGTVTDADGRFTFPERLKGGDVLVFTFIGLDTKEYIVRESNVENFEMNISLSMCMMVTMGEVQVDGLYSAQPKPSLWQRIRKLF